MAQRDSLRILYVTDEYPWPPTHGYRMRIANIVAGLGRVGAVDLFCTVHERTDLPHGDAGPQQQVARLFLHHRPAAKGGLRPLVAWWRSGWPRAVAWTHWEEARAALATWAQPAYDVVWFSHCHTWLALGQLQRGPEIVDLDNLEDEKLRTLMRMWQLQRAERLTRPALQRRLRRRLGDRLDRVDLRRWARAQKLAAETACAVVVCSDLDRDRLGRADAIVVPNAYELSGPAAETDRSTDRVLTMVGLLIYPPNLDGARFFAHRVLPLIRREVPDARFRLVGRHDGELDDLAAIPGVEILGEVDSLDGAFASTAAVVVPLRAGSGTRIKVLEAFAWNLPVVSTRLGCEGLAVRNGVDLLVADSPDELATACIEVLTDPARAGSLAASGHQLWEERYRADQVRDAVAALARRVAP